VSAKFDKGTEINRLTKDQLEQLSRFQPDLLLVILGKTTCFDVHALRILIELGQARAESLIDLEEYLYEEG